jgi:hypothetical protein
VLSAAEYDLLWTRLRLGAMPAVLWADAPHSQKSLPATGSDAIDGRDGENTRGGPSHGRDGMRGETTYGAHRTYSETTRGIESVRRETIHGADSVRGGASYGGETMRGAHGMRSAEDVRGESNHDTRTSRGAEGMRGESNHDTRTSRGAEGMRGGAGQPRWSMRGSDMPRGVEPLVERLSAVLARPTWSIDARLHLHGQGAHRVSALAATDGTTGVLATRTGSRVTLLPVEPDESTTSIVGLLPPSRPGNGVSITLPAANLDQAAARAGANAVALQRELVADGLGRDEARKIADVLRDVIRTGQFGVSHLPRSGPVRRAEQVVTFYDTNKGRYLFVRQAGWVTLVGANDAAIVDRIDRMRANLAQS